MQNAIPPTVFPLGVSAGDIAQPLPAHLRYMDDLDLARCLHGGTKAMRHAGRRYLPQEEGETDKAYRNRLSRSVLANYYKRTLEKLVGQVFAEDLEPTNDLPDAVYALLADIDPAGANASVFMRDAFYTAMHKGLCHVMVEYPQVWGPHARRPPPGRWKVFQLDDGASEWRDAIDPETGERLEGTTSLPYIPWSRSCRATGRAR